MAPLTSAFYLALTAGNLTLLGFCLGELRVAAPILPIAALMANRARMPRVLAQLKGRSPFPTGSSHV
jgi:hypothetical protein